MSDRPVLRLRGSRPKSYRWTHQGDLETGLGKMIHLLLADGKLATGELLNADQFALKVFDDPARPSGTTYFKHSIAAYHFG